MTRPIDDILEEMSAAQTALTQFVEVHNGSADTWTGERKDELERLKAAYSAAAREFDQHPERDLFARKIGRTIGAKRAKA